jgi:site-specific recombinase XerD
VPTSHQKTFVNTSRGELSTHAVATSVASLAHQAGLSQKITPHMLRHTVATLLLRNGANLRVVQEFLGHSSISTTERYTRVCRDDLRTALYQHHPNQTLSWHYRELG